jgi:hypothetical protein
MIRIKGCNDWGGAACGTARAAHLAPRRGRVLWGGILGC